LCCCHIHIGTYSLHIAPPKQANTTPFLLEGKRFSLPQTINFNQVKGSPSSALLTTMPRDDLTINAHFRSMPPGMGHEHLDPMIVLEDFTSRASNLPAEIQFMQDEIAHKEHEMQALMDSIHAKDAQLQKFVRVNGSLAPNPKDPVLQKAVSDHYDKAQLLQEEKCALATRTQQALDRQIRYLDIQLKILQDRGEFPADDLPSLLRPPPEPAAVRASLSSSALAQAQQAPPTTGGPARLTVQQISAQRMAAAQQAQQGITHISVSAPATPAAALLLQRQSRESSAGAANKRQRIAGGLGSLPATSSGLARHASTGPATPKAGTPTSTRAGSAGPRASQKAAAAAKKVAPHKVTTSTQRAKPGKSGLSRVKRTGTKNSPSSTNESELSEAESASLGDEDELATPPPIKKVPQVDEDMFDAEEDEGSDDKKYCTCQKVSFGDMVACDNDECPYEWFHWPCVGLKSEPVGTWICPVCTQAMKHKK
jgi:inhibitor of growth protein 3